MYSSAYLSNLKEKFNNLNIDYNEILGFSTKIIMKQQFATEYLTLFKTKVKFDSRRKLILNKKKKTTQEESKK